VIPDIDHLGLAINSVTATIYRPVATSSPFLSRPSQLMDCYSRSNVRCRAIYSTSWPPTL